MKSINAKRIAAVAASLLMGLAFAAGSSGVMWNNVPITNTAGQPVVQIVVGSSAQPSDGVVAANIAAVIGSLAFTSVNVTATPSGLSNVKCVVTTPTCTLTNQQVWFNEKGFSAPSGSYSFAALIGSVLNGGVTVNSPSNTKALSSSPSYTYPETNPLATQISPTASPFGPISQPPTSVSVVATTNGGGLTFQGSGSTSGPFTLNAQDNLLKVTTSQLPSLLNNWGTYGESETLWITGHAVYDQQQTGTPTQTFAIFNVGGAYQVTFNTGIAEPYYSTINPAAPHGTNTINNAAIKLLGKNWTIINYTTPTQTVTTANAVSGNSKLTLAASLTPLQTVYVGHNITSNNFSVELTDLGQTVTPAGGTSYTPAAVDVYYNGNITKITSLNPKTITKFTVGSHSVYVDLNTTFAGLYAYQKWAQIKLYSNTLNITSGQLFNQSGAPGWRVYLFWTNGTVTSGGGGYPNELKSIVIYNQTPQTLTPGGTFNFIAPNFTTYKVNFVGDTLGTNWDPVTYGVSAQTNLQYKNPLAGTAFYPSAFNSSTGGTGQPGELLTISSQITNAFAFAGQTGSTVVYDLTPYEISVPASNTLKIFGSTSPLQGGVGVNVTISSTVGDGNIINSNNPLTVTLYGFSSNTAATLSGATPTQLGSVVFSSLTPVGGQAGAENTLLLNTPVFNVTSIQMNRALPYITINVVANGISPNPNMPGNTLAELQTIGTPEILYQTAGLPYEQLQSGTVTYDQYNGQAYINGGIQVKQTSITNPSAGAKQYFTVNTAEYNVPGSTSYEDALLFGVVNSSTGGAQNFGFQVNQSADLTSQTPGTKNNMTYLSSQYFAGTLTSTVQAPLYFVTERGSKIASMQPGSSGSVTVNYAKTVDTLQVVVSPTSAVINSTSHTQSVGPVGVAQAVPGFSNLTVSRVNATCAFSSTSCTVTGLSNLTATPSVSQAVVPVVLNTTHTPLVVLDNSPTTAATLIVVGSKYVNSVAGQIFTQFSSLNSSFGPGSVVVQAYGNSRILVAGYTANQTVQAGNKFIDQLLQAAGTT